MPRQRSKHAVEQSALNVFLPATLARAFDDYIATGSGHSRPKKLLVGTALNLLVKLSPRQLDAAIADYQADHLGRTDDGEHKAGKPASVHPRPADSPTESRPASRRAG
jgi:hypothetical protein